MKAWSMTALVAVVAAAGYAASSLAPSVAAQARVRVTAPSAVDVFGARGSRIGVSVRDVEERDITAGRPASPGGVVIEEVSEDSAAEKGGMRKGDLVVAFDGERVRSARQFSRLVQETPPGRKVQVSMLRDGQKVDVTVEPRAGGGFEFSEDDVRALGELGRDFSEVFPVWPSPPAPPAPPAPPSGPMPPAPPPPPRFPDFESYIWRSGSSLGITAGNLTDQLGEYFGAKSGVLVTSVSEGSAAAKAGLKAGDVVTAVNGSDVSSPSDLRRRIQRLRDGDELTLNVVRDKKQMTLKGKAEVTRSSRTYRSDV
jgi:serine protease Do